MAAPVRLWLTHCEHVCKIPKKDVKYLNLSGRPSVRLCAVVLLLLLSCLHIGSADRVKEKIYIDFDNSLTPACIRLLDASGQIGCSSSSGGNVGVIHYCQEASDLEYVIKDGAHQPYVPLLEPHLFTKSNLARLKESGVERISGLLVIHTAESLKEHVFTEQERFSPDAACPNDAFGSNECSVKWNENANEGLMFEQFPFPMFLLKNGSNVNTTIKCYEKFNVAKAESGEPEFPLCSAELTSFMVAANSSITCIRRSNLMVNLSPSKYCDPMSGKNVYATFLPTSADGSVGGPYKFIALSARLDSFSMFDATSPGADSTITGVVTILATAFALGEARRSSPENDTFSTQEGATNILFMLFAGEAFGYIGSSRAVWDMNHTGYPLPASKDTDNPPAQPQNVNLTYIKYLMEVQQVANAPYFVHASHAEAETGRLLAAVENSQKSGVPEFPPASLQRFLLAKSDQPALVLTGFNSIYTNKYLNSRLDLPSALNVTFTNEEDLKKQNIPLADRLATLALELAKFLLIEMSPTQEPILPTHDVVVEEVKLLLYCFTFNRKCSLFFSIIDPDEVKKYNSSRGSEPFPTYVSVENRNAVSDTARHLLGYYLRENITDTSKSGCKADDSNNKVFTYSWVRGSNASNPGVCVKSTVRSTTAESPAFSIEDYDFTLNPGQYSTWTESQWQNTYMRIFLVPSDKHKYTTLGVGLAVAFIAVGIAAFASYRADLLFGSGAGADVQAASAAVST